MRRGIGVRRGMRIAHGLPVIWLLLQTVTLEPVHKGADGIRVSILDAIELGDRRFVVERRGESLVVEGGGSVGPKGGVMLLGDYAVRIESILTNKGAATATRSWLYRTGTIMRGKTVSLADVNGNGIWNERQCDALIVGGQRIPLDKVVPIKGKLFEIDVAADGRSVTMRDTGRKAPKIPSSPRVLADINALRAAVGVSPVGLDVEFSRACERHLKYLAIVGYGKNDGVDAHAEDPNHPAFSDAGLAAARNSYIGWGHGSPEAFFASNLRTWYHRIGYVNPDLTSVGVGATGGLSAIDVGSSRLRWRGLSAPIVLPYDGMRDAPCAYTREGPNPIESGRDPNTCGTAIQCIFPEGGTLAEPEVFVEDQYGNAVAGFVAPFDTPFTLDHVVGMIPRETLAPQTTYHVTVRCAWNGRPYVREWSFTTGAR